MERHLKILEMAAKDELPESIDERTGLPLDIITELVDAGYLKAIDDSSFERIAYMAPIITLPGREYLERLRIQERSSTIKMATPKIRLFISHSAADHNLVERLLELLRSALGLPASQIRCTSIDGYRLPVGARTDEQLRQEVHEAEAFVGIISSSSLHSLYVAFELGARWGAGLPLFPVLAPGTDPSILGGPLAGLNALSVASRPQLHQLISDLAKVLGVKSEEPAVYERHLEMVLQLTKQGGLIPNNNEKHSNVKTSAFDEAYKHFTNQLSYALGRYKVFSSNLAPDKEKYTEVGVLERLNEVKSARLQLLSVCGEHVRSTLLEAGTDWLEDMDLFGKTAPSIMEKLSRIAFKDRV